MTGDRALAAVLRRERTVTLVALALVAALAWASLLRLGHQVAAMAGMAMDPVPWTAADLARATAMWAVMMVAMMLPAATPMVLTFVTMNRTRTGGGAGVPTGIFVLGYAAVWTAFAVAAAAAQWGLHAAALTSPDAMRLTPLAGAAVLAAAGIYQLTPLKYACLARCRSPLGFLIAEWRDGATGALVMGLRHGLFCLGCCWLLMALLFAGGVMQLGWVAVLAAFVLVEKVLPAPRLVGVASAVLLLAAAAAGVLLR